MPLAPNLDLLEAQEWAKEVRRHIHRYPELSGQEHNTAEFLKNRLLELGVTILPVADSSSFIAYVESIDSPITVGLRAELDALPIKEETGLKFSSERESLMHACGHDMHAAILVGLIYRYQVLKRKPAHNLLLCFESSEEVLPGGAEPIMKSPAWIAHKPNAMLGLHCEPTMPVGHVGIKPGAYMASGDEIYITIHGKGGHAAIPHQLVDTILVASQTVIALQSIRAREIPTEVPLVLSIGNIVSHGAMNLIPDKVILEGTLRVHSEEWRVKAKELIHRIVRGIAESYGAQAEVDIRSGYPMLFNNLNLTREAARIFSNTAIIEAVERLDLRMTTDDFSRFAEEVPGLFFRLGVGPTSGLHTAKFCPDEQSIGIGIEAFYQLIERADYTHLA